MGGAMVVLHQSPPRGPFSGFWRLGKLPSGRPGMGGSAFKLPSVPASDARSEVYFACRPTRRILYLRSPPGRGGPTDSLYLIRRCTHTAAAPPPERSFPVGSGTSSCEGNPDGELDRHRSHPIRKRGRFAPGSRADEPIWTLSLGLGGEDCYPVRGRRTFRRMQCSSSAPA